MRTMTYMEIAGKRYPLRFSLAAMRAVTEKFGSMDKMGGIMSGDMGIETLDALVCVLGILIRQGCEYKNLFESACAPAPDDPVEDGKYIPLSDEALCVALGLQDIPAMTQTITETMRIGQTQEIMVEMKHKEKNVQAT